MKQKTDYTKINKEELLSMLETKRHELRELRFRAATHELKKVNEVDKLKKEVARILTALSTLKA